MSLNIKNERTHALVRELAEILGVGQTSAVEDAVRRRLEELRSHAPRPAGRFSAEETARRRARVERLIVDLHRLTTPVQRADLATAVDDLYDERGLPR